MTCCSGSTFAPAPDAALDPSKRVNFTFGMVLGVDDFRQEHLYLATRDERGLRETIGYGVISGLEVKTDPPPPSAASKVEVRVTPGLALLPDGKLVAVTVDQCASLGDWLSGPDKRNDSGDHSVYVVLRYAETAGTPVPIPGEPCRDESALQADSRIADSFTLDFSWTPPASREDDALRSFVAWLRRIEVQAHPSPAPDLGAFQAAVEQAVAQAIQAGWPANGNPPLAETPAPAATLYQNLVIPYDHYAEFVSAAFDVWIRRLRALYLAKHGPVPPAEDGAENGLLLGTIDCKLTAGALSSLAGVRLLGRPQLAHQRLLQEWLLTKADDAPRNAHYVLGNSDPRLPDAQDLHAAFAGAARRMAKVEISGSDGVLQPALIWPGNEAGADYYGPDMDTPIPVADGGTGQSAGPQPGQLLVGAPESVPPTFTLGWLTGATHGEGDAQDANINVDVNTAAPNILLDTVQNIDPDASPSFAGLTVSGTLTAGALEVSGPATVTGAFTANGGVTAGGLNVAPLASAVIGSNAAGDFVKAVRWDGVEANVGNEATYYYAPGQGQPVRIEDGGTGLSARPQPLQMLVGRNDDAPPEYVLANLVAGRNVTLSLQRVVLPSPIDGPARPGPVDLPSPVDIPTRPDRVDQPSPIELPMRRLGWNVTIEAAGSDITLPLAPAQGGTGQVGTPQNGQILVGNDGGSFAIGDVIAANGGRNLNVNASAGGITLDTVQDLNPEAIPTFADLRLTKFPATPATHTLGWNSETSEVVLGGASAGRKVLLLKSAPEFPQTQEDLKALGSDDLVLVYLGDAQAQVALPPPLFDGQELVIKVGPKAPPVLLADKGTVDQGAIGLEAGRSLILIGAVRLKLWLVIGRS